MKVQVQVQAIKQDSADLKILNLLLLHQVKMKMLMSVIVPQCSFYITLYNQKHHSAMLKKPPKNVSLHWAGLSVNLWSSLL